MSWDEASIDVCRRFTSDAPGGVVFNEPYLPFIPEAWNGVLILGCAENLGAKKVAREYRARLESMKAIQPELLFTRLQEDVDGRPWNNDRVTLSLRAIWPRIKFDQLGCSNAVPWSITMDGNRDTQKDCTPTKEMKRSAVQFWISLLRVWPAVPRRIPLMITLGTVAFEVVAKVQRESGLTARVLRLYFPNDRVDYWIKKRQAKPEEIDQVQAAAALFNMRPLSSRVERYACHALGRVHEQFGDSPDELLK